MEASGATTLTETSPEPPESGTAPGSAPGSGGEPGGQGDGDRDESGKFLSREAASYRVRLREAEAERDSLRERLDRLQRAEVERLASAGGLAVAGDVWQFGASLDTLRGEDGTIDAETVEGLIAALLRDRPGLRSTPVGDVGIGRGGAARGQGPAPKVGLSQLLKPGRAA